MNNQRRALFLSHGGGPLPLLGNKGHTEMVSCLKEIAVTIKRPSAIIVVSAHWEASHPTITSSDKSTLLYDYYGFPEESYEIEYPCPGEPGLSRSIAEQLNNAGFKTSIDMSRGFDHSHFVPLKIMYPEADIPCVQLSLLNSLIPSEHIRLGRSLQNLGNQSLLLIGSGFSFHNMQAFFTAETKATRAMNESFEHWLLETLSNQNFTEDKRRQKLIAWESAPFARYCHPREEHLLPLHVCYGFAASACSSSYELQIFNKKSSMYLWEIES